MLFRSAFRVRPGNHSPQVRLTHPQHTTELRARILDLSVGGLAMLLPPELTPWPEGTILPGLTLELDRDTRFQASLRVRHVHVADAKANSYTQPSGTLLGLAFAQIEPAAARALQLYIDQAQKRSRLLRQD